VHQYYLENLELLHHLENLEHLVHQYYLEHLEVLLYLENLEPLVLLLVLVVVPPLTILNFQSNYLNYLLDNFVVSGLH
jgi:hypothetical protein